jgi:hypothetical protein
MMMKKLIIFLLLSVPLVIARGQDPPNYIWNPETDQPDYISRVYPANDSTINFGTNNTLSEDTLNGVIGHSNIVNAERAMVIGYMNLVEKSNNLLFGAYVEADTTHTVTIGRGLNMSNRMVNSRYGSIGLGYFSSAPIMYIQSGYEPGEPYTADIGGVSIGGPDLDSLTALQINAHLSDPDAYFLKCKNWGGGDVFTVDYDGNAELSGILTVDSVVCTHVPTIHQAAGDTTNYNTPDKIGDMFIDTLAGDTYISVGSSRGDWVKLNLVWPLVVAMAFNRRRRHR